MMYHTLRDQFAFLWGRRVDALGTARRARTLVTAIGALAFVVLSPQIARATDLNLSDSTFLPANWQLNVFASPSTSTVTASTSPTGGIGNSPFRQVTDVVGATAGIAIGVQIDVAPGSVFAGPIVSIDGSIRYKCIVCPGGSGEAFGLAVMQQLGSSTYYYRSFPQGLTLQNTAWSTTSFTQTGLTSADFYLMNANGTWNTTAHPNFANPDARTWCGFFTGNSSPASGGGAYTTVAGYDDWTCAIHGPKVDTAQVKICKVAGPGIPVGTQFKFSAGSFGGLVPAGPAPGGYCVLGPSVPVGSVVTVQEGVPSGVSVSGITVEPANRSLGNDLGMGIAKITAGTGVTEVTYTNQRIKQEKTGYIEICKAGDVKGNFTFTVNPGALGPFTVPAGACSPAIEVTAGNVTISEAPNAFVIVGSATLPASRQGPWTANTSKVTVVQGNISTQTIVTITNGNHK
jgi:hypothetical protein